MFSTNHRESGTLNDKYYDNIIIGGGPIGSSTAMFLSEENKNENTLLICDDKDRGSYEDWSKILRLSLDSNINEYNLSKHSYDIIQMLDEIRSTKPGHNIMSIQSGVLFLASPNTNLAKKCLYSLNNNKDYNDDNDDEDQFKLLNIKDINDIFNISLNLPKETLCFYHPRAAAINPIELVYTLRGLAQNNGLQIMNNKKIVSLKYIDNDDKILICSNDNDIFSTKNLYLFCGARNKELGKDFAKEFDETYITAISTIRYNANCDVNVHPIILGQLDLDKSMIDHQANFSVIPEIDDNGNNIVKIRLSGKNGSEVIETREGLDCEYILNQNDEMIKLSKNIFGELLPYIDNEKPLDFNRCCTYRNHFTHFNGTSLLNIPLSTSSSIMTTVGCYGVGVKFAPVLGEAAVAFKNNESVQDGIKIFESGDNANIEMDFVEKAF